LEYRFKRVTGGLSFERVVVSGDQVSPLTVALAALTSGRVAGPSLSATADDMAVDLALGHQRQGLLPQAVVPPLIRAMTPALKITLDGKPVTTDGKAVGLAAEAKDDGMGVRLRIIQDPGITELFENGIALCETVLRPVILPQLSPSERELVRDGQLFGVRDLADLVATTIPALAAKMPVLTRSHNLPSSKEYIRPELEINALREGHALRLEAAIIYGREPLARLRADRFTPLGDTVPVRDPAVEAELSEQLQRIWGMDLEAPLVLGGAAAVAMAQRLTRFPGTITGDGLAEFRLHTVLEPRLEWPVGDEALQMTPNFTFAALTSTPGEIKFASANEVASVWQRGESLVPLMGGGFAPLPHDWLRRHGDKLLDFLASRGDSADTVSRLAWPHLADLADTVDGGAEQLPPLFKDFCSQLKNGQAALNLDVSAPTQLRATLRPYQLQGYQWLRWLRELGLGALLADDMGLGKTVQTLSVISGRTLIVAPTSVLFNWAKEAARFRPDLKTCVYHGPNRHLDGGAQLVITSYALLRLDLNKFQANTWETLVLDEAQTLKNAASQAAKAARQIKASFKLGLSGTPVENRLDDLWSLMHILNPGLLGDRRYFQDRYARPVEQGDAVRTAALRSRIAPFVLRRRKSEVLTDLPPRTETLLYAELSATERDRYEVVRAASRKEIIEQLQRPDGEGGGVNMIAALEALLRLRQAACHPDLLPGVSGEASSKLSLLVETLQTSTQNGHKTLVFSQWTGFLDLMEPALECAGLSFLRLDGSTRDRNAVVEGFQKPEGPPILLISLKAGGVGLNLTAADHVIIADPWWNPATEDQAADRAHRIGQERPVLIQRLVALDTVEERILQLQERKRQIAAAAIDGQQMAGTSITKEDLLALVD
jgi:superfamily II DNA or RNA helicase